MKQIGGKAGGKKRWETGKTEVGKVVGKAERGVWGVGCSSLFPVGPSAHRETVFTTPRASESVGNPGGKSGGEVFEEVGSLVGKPVGNFPFSRRAEALVKREIGTDSSEADKRQAERARLAADPRFAAWVAGT
jgi:hypothetical protein